MDARVHNSSHERRIRRRRFQGAACRGSLTAMTEVMHTPPALRWVALFLAACAVLGLFLGFRDQIRKNPPGWYTGAEQVATPLPATADGAREAVAFDPNAPQARSGPGPATTVAAPTPTPPKTSTVDAADTPDAAPPPAIPTAAAATPRPKPAISPPAPKPAARPAAQADPVGDILEGQKQAETPPTVPY